MYLYVSNLALDILTLSAPSFVTQDRLQRMEIKEVKGSIRYRDTYRLKIVNSPQDFDPYV